VRGILASIAAALLTALPGTALAHGAIEGIDGFYAGLVHPALVPAHIMVLLGLGLWFGQGEVKAAGLPLLAFAAALPLGLAGSLAIAPGPLAPRLLLATALVLGLMVAAAWKPPTLIAAGLGAAAGLLLGLDSAPEAGVAGGAAAVLAGTWVGAQFILLDTIGLAILARRAWMRTGVRVLGSWTAASALMVLALALT
jgi:urease accessory protein